MRVYLIERNYQPTEIDAADAASRFIGWLADAANPVLAEIIQCWLWGPPDAGGLGALAESAGDVALLRTHVTTTWLLSEPGHRTSPQGVR